MERVLTPGPEVAKHPSMFASPPAQAAARSAEATARVRRALRRTSGEDVYPIAYYLAVAAALAVTGYPAWRIAVVAIGGVALQVGTLARRRAMRARQCVNADFDQIARRRARVPTCRA